MRHYICTGECHGESPNPGVCQSETCSRSGEMLLECNCEDGLHEHLVLDHEDDGPELLSHEDEYEK